MKHEVIYLTDDDYDLEDDIAPEYDLPAMRKAAQEAGFDTRARLVRIASDVAAVFPDEEAVNQALRELIAARTQAAQSESQSSTI
jgi:hypothetical protein